MVHPRIGRAAKGEGSDADAAAKLDVVSTTIYLIRHGEADESAGDDPGLTERGRDQAHAVGRRVKDLGFDDVVHSSRRRARETASIVGLATGGPAPRHSEHADDRTPFPSDLALVPEGRRAWFESVPDDERDEDGRDLDLAIAGLGRLEAGDRRVLVVTHNFVIGWFVRDAMGAPPLSWMGLNSANGGLTIVRYEIDRQPRLIAFNDTGHLPAL